MVIIKYPSRSLVKESSTHLIFWLKISSFWGHPHPLTMSLTFSFQHLVYNFFQLLRPSDWTSLLLFSLDDFTFFHQQRPLYGCTNKSLPQDATHNHLLSLFCWNPLYDKSLIFHWFQDFPCQRIQGCPFTDNSPFPWILTYLLIMNILHQYTNIH